nr:hypothetical protein [Tanacetum cinerariifolium]
SSGITGGPSSPGDTSPDRTNGSQRNMSQGVKENQEKDKIGSKPDKNEKRVEAEKSLKQLQWVEEEN